MFLIQNKRKYTFASWNRGEVDAKVALWCYMLGCFENIWRFKSCIGLVFEAVESRAVFFPRAEWLKLFPFVLGVFGLSARLRTGTAVVETSSSESTNQGANEKMAKYMSNQHRFQLSVDKIISAAVLPFPC